MRTCSTGRRHALFAVALCGVLGSGAARAQDEGGEPAAEPADATATEAVDAAAPAEEGMDGGGMEVPAEAPSKASKDAQYTRELRAIEQRVHGLKEKVFQSKANLELLRELVIEGAASGAMLRLTHVDDLARAYAVEGIDYFLDGRNVYTWSEASTEPMPDGVVIREAAVGPGQHALQVSLVVRGNADVLSYLEDYRVTVESSYAFEVAGGTVADLTVRVVSKGGVRKRFVERPTVVYEERRESVRVE